MVHSYLSYIGELRTATLILQEQVSNTRELSYAQIQALGSTFSSSEMSSLDGAAGTISFSPYQGESEITKITFTIDWTGSNGLAKSQSIVTMMTEDGINKK